MSSDGILRLDLDLEDALMPNGTHHPSVDGTGTFKEAAGKQLGPSADEVQTEPEVNPQKKVIKPPMQSTKEGEPIAKAEEETDGIVKKVCTHFYTIKKCLCTSFCYIKWSRKYDLMFVGPEGACASI